MSNRTLIEINHDYTSEMGGRFLIALVQYMRSGSMSSGNEDLEEFGVRIISQRHHSEKYHIPPNAPGFEAAKES